MLEPDCSDWAMMIEHNNIDREMIDQRITAALNDHADVIVLGCTHYHWIEEEIACIASGKAIVMQPEEPVIQQLKRVISRLP